MFFPWWSLLALSVACAKDELDDAQQPVQSKVTDADDRADILKNKFDYEYAFSGITTFAHLPYTKCLIEPDTKYDIAIVGVPFDTSVTYRPGARFGPRAIRAASTRQSAKRGYNPRAKMNPYTSWAHILDCGDISPSPFDNALALRQMTEGFKELLSRKTVSGPKRPKLIALGGDHSIALPELRALNKVYGEPITVLHFDAHLDTWYGGTYDDSWLDPNIPVEEQQSSFTHGTMFWLAWHEGLIRNGSVHAGLRTRLSGVGDNQFDSTQGWKRIASDAIAYDDLGPSGIAQEILNTIGTERPVYLSVDIDVIDPGLCPGTGTPEPGGWTTRELIQVLRNIESLNVVGADIVEVSPSYDGTGEQTALAAAQIAYEILTSMVKVDVDKYGGDKGEKEVKDEL